MSNNAITLSPWGPQKAYKSVQGGGGSRKLPFLRVRTFWMAPSSGFFVILSNCMSEFFKQDDF